MSTEERNARLEELTWIKEDLKLKLRYNEKTKDDLLSQLSNVDREIDNLRKGNG